MRRLVILLALIAIYIVPTWASWGDEEPPYLDCLGTCTSTCSSASPLSLPLRLLRWTCPENCRYKCMHQITSQKRVSGEQIEQYHGKWPFYRFLGLQEPASIVFSVLNGLEHYKGYRDVVQKMTTGYPMRSYYVLYAIVNANAWFWSAVFHARDTGWTERADYFAAASIILYAFYVACVRAGHLYRRERRGLWRALTGVCLLLYAVHVGYLSILERFDYTYNVIACAVIGGLSNTLWVVWAIVNRKRPYAWKIAALALAISGATALELFDFPPWFGVFDAHSLWHASTILLVRGFYNFVREDAAWEVNEGGWERRDR